MRTVAFVICLFVSLVTMHAQGEDTGAGGCGYRGYWLKNKDMGEFVYLVLSRRPLADIPKVSWSADKPLLECDAIVVTTYAKDSIWNIDLKPFKPLVGVEKVGADSITIDGRDFSFTQAKLEDVKKLLKNPEGKIPLHRKYGPILGQEDFVKSLELKIGQQLEGIKEETNQQHNQPDRQ